MTNINEQEIAGDLRNLGLKSCWGGSDGVFIDSEDASRVVKLLTFLHEWVRPETKRTSFNEIAKIIKLTVGNLNTRVRPLDLE